MKRVSALIVAGLVTALTVVPAMADTFSYDAESGKISGNYESDGLINIYVDGDLAGGDSLITDAEANKQYTVEVYENGELVLTEVVDTTVVEPTNDDPSPAPTEPTNDDPAPAPTEPTNDDPAPAPAEPTNDDPAPAPAEVTVTPTPEPSTPPSPAPTKKTDAAGKDSVPKTGEFDYAIPAVSILALGAAGMLIFKRKRA